MITSGCGEPRRAALEVLWSLTAYCNYECSYCSLPRVASPSDGCLKFDLCEVEDALSALRFVRGKIHVGLTGGEPTTHPQAGEILRLVSSLSDTTSIITNLSSGSSFFMDSIPQPLRMGISASYQIESVTWEDFSRNVIELRDAGFGISCTYVDYPLFRDALAKNLPRIRDEIGPNVPFLRHRYWDGSRFPDEDISEGSIEVPPKIDGEFQPKDIVSKMWSGEPKMCRAGMDYICIMNDGRISRCPSLIPLFGDVWPKVRLAEQPLVCDGLCLCTDMHRLWEDGNIDRNMFASGMLKKKGGDTT